MVMENIKLNLKMKVNATVHYVYIFDSRNSAAKFVIQEG